MFAVIVKKDDAQIVIEESHVEKETDVHLEPRFVSLL